MAFNLAPSIAGLTLCKMVGEDLRMTETVMFAKGAPAVDTVLRRARIAGRVEVGDGIDLGDFWADLVTRDGSIESHAALDAGSFRALKDYWLRVRYCLES